MLWNYAHASNSLAEEFYKAKGELRLGYYSNNKTKTLAGRKHELMWETKKELDRVSKRKGDKIRERLWAELGVIV